MVTVYTDERCLEHFAPGHPERPERVASAVTALRANPHADRQVWPEVWPAEPGLIARVHHEPHVRRVEDVAKSGGGWMDPDTFVVPQSYLAACLAAGATTQAVRDVLSGAHENALVLVRPPGHHATATRSMGFCLFNNVAVAAQWAIDEGGAQRVAIADIDVHHGNGTQDIFYTRPDVLYYSTHQFPFYPGTGRLEDAGSDDGVGTTVNLPLMPGCGDETFESATDRLLAPSLRRFNPDLVIISVGFDAHWADPLAQMRMSLNGYAAVLKRIGELAEELCAGRLVVVLEGGYDLKVIAGGVLAAAELLDGREPASDPVGPPPVGSEPLRAEAVIGAARTLHRLP
ncbi:MAG: putative deacetylase [Chloroflexi bacterium]|nr:putative deacetylase [Chloroflexota bacterium]